MRRYFFGELVLTQDLERSRRAGGAPPTSGKNRSGSGSLTNFGEDARGELFAVSGNGAVYRVLSGG